MKPNRTSPRCASVETLESRRLLSAAPMSMTAAITAAPSAVHTHPTVPSILGTYEGTYAATNGSTGQVIITIVSEAKTGRLAGTLTIVGIGTVGITGSVGLKGKFSLIGAARHLLITASGSVSSDLSTLSGKYNSVAKHGSNHGTFTASRTPT